MEITDMNYNKILREKREELMPKPIKLSMNSQLFKAHREGLDIDFVSGRDDGEEPSKVYAKSSTNFKEGDYEELF